MLYPTNNHNSKNNNKIKANFYSCKCINETKLKRKSTNKIINSHLYIQRFARSNCNKNNKNKKIERYLGCFWTHALKYMSTHTKQHIFYTLLQAFISACNMQNICAFIFYFVCVSALDIFMYSLQYWFVFDCKFLWFDEWMNEFFFSVFLFVRINYFIEPSQGNVQFLIHFWTEIRPS